MRAKFICIIWTTCKKYKKKIGSWGLSLFVLFEHEDYISNPFLCSWGLSLFVLFEHKVSNRYIYLSSWGLSLFVLFERHKDIMLVAGVLEG